MKFEIFLTVFLSMVLTAQLWAIEKKKVSFNNGDITLNGTLYLPKGKGPFPAVVFVHGSGPETRKNSSYSAKWMASIGYAALIYDKRGTGKSDGQDKDWNRFNFKDLAGDVVAAVHYLSSLQEIDDSKIGIHASSEGGWVAPLAASKTEKINFMIIRSASVSTVGEDRIFERSARLKREGFSKEAIAEAQNIQLVEGKNNSDPNSPDNFTQLFEKNKNKDWFARVYPGTDPFENWLVEYRLWYASIVDFDPVPYLQKIQMPIFWIFGDSALDQLGPVEKSIERLKKLKQQGKVYEILQLAGEGHNVSERKYEFELFQWLNKVNGDQGFPFKKH